MVNTHVVHGYSGTLFSHEKGTKLHHFLKNGWNGRPYYPRERYMCFISYVEPSKTPCMICQEKAELGVRGEGVQGRRVRTMKGK